MMTKYVCMDDDFMTEDEGAARQHMQEKDHRVVEVGLTDSTPMCSLLGEEEDTGEDLSDEDVEDDEMMSEEEEEE